MRDEALLGRGASQRGALGTRARPPGKSAAASAAGAEPAPLSRGGTAEGLQALADAAFALSETGRALSGGVNESLPSMWRIGNGRARMNTESSQEALS